MLWEQCSETIEWLTYATLLFHSTVLGCFGVSRLSTPTIGSHNLVYACADNEVVAFWGNGTRAWTAHMNQTCQLGIAPVIDYKGRIYVAAGNTVVVVSPPTSKLKKPVAANFLEMVPAYNLEQLGEHFSIMGLAVTSWSSVLYINTGAGIHVFMLDGTPLWSSLVQFNNSVMTSPKALVSCVNHLTICHFLSSPAVDECDGSIYVARSDGWVYALTTWQPFLKWRFHLNVSTPLLSAKVVAGSNGYVYVSTVEHSTLYAISAKLGTLMWKTKVGPLGDRSGIPLVDLAGYVSIASLDGFVYVLSPEGVQLQRYLADSTLSPVTIQTPPVLDCSGTAIYVAQSLVDNKTIEQVDGLDIISFSKMSSITIRLFVPSLGHVLWSTWYPGSNKQIISLVISIIVIFLLLAILLVLAYIRWKRNLAIRCQRLCILLKKKRFQYPQLSLLRSKKAHECRLNCLKAKLKLEPSVHLMEHVQATLEALDTIDRYLALLPLDTPLNVQQGDPFTDRISLDRYLSSELESKKLSSFLLLFKSFCLGETRSLECMPDLEEAHLLHDMSMDTNACKSSSEGINEGCTLSIDAQTTAANKRSLSMKFLKNVRKAQSKMPKQLTVEGGKPFADMSLVEFTNPLYQDQLRPLAPLHSVRKRTVTFPPVTEIFEESVLCGSCTSEEGPSCLENNTFHVDISNDIHHFQGYLVSE